MQKELDEVYTFSPCREDPLYRINKRNFEEYLKKSLRKSNLLDTQKIHNTRYYEDKELICKHIFDLLSTPFGKAYIFRYIEFQENLIQKIQVFKEVATVKRMQLLLSCITKFEKEVLEI